MPEDPARTLSPELKKRIADSGSPAKEEKDFDTFWERLKQKLSEGKTTDGSAPR